MHLLGVIGLCISSSALTAWLLLASGIIKPDASQTISSNRESIVLQQGEIVAEVFKKVSPSTVSITTEAQAGSDRFFNPSVQEGKGSGIIVSADGYVLTNKHVIPSGTAKVTVILADGKEYKDVTVVGRDPLNDLAFLKINGVNNLPAATIGDSDSVEAGQQVVAIGNALGEFRNSVTSGIVSGKGRPIEAADSNGGSEQLRNLLQTDAAINPGNSGGPLVNLKGEVIGVNTAIAEDSEAIGFAIPINDAKGLITSVTTQGKVIRPYLGVRYISLTPQIAEEAEVSVTQGAYVYGSTTEGAVIDGSPAAKAGLQRGDVITKVNATAVTEDNALGSLLAKYKPGDKLTLTIWRDGKEQTTAVTLEAYPES